MTTLAEMVAVQRDLVIDTFLAKKPVAWVDPGYKFRDGPFLGKPTSRSEIRPVLTLPALTVLADEDPPPPAWVDSWVVVELSPDEYSDFTLVGRGQRKSPRWTQAEIVERLTLAWGFVDIDAVWLRKFCKQCGARHESRAKIANLYSVSAATAMGLRRLRAAERAEARSRG